MAKPIVRIDDWEHASAPHADSGERGKRRIERTMSWVLLANVVLFWIATCVTAFAQVPAGWTPVYGYYSTNNGAYTYSTSAQAGAGWRGEGVKFRVQADATAVDGVTPAALRKLTSQGATVLTTDGAEVQSLRAAGWTDEGVLGYVATRASAGLVPLYRLKHESQKWNLYSTKIPTKDFVAGAFGWDFAGVAGYVKPPHDGTAAIPASWPSLPSAPVPPVAGTAPTVTSFSPASALAGATVTVKGSNFQPGIGVKFNGVAATTVNKLSSSELTAVVPATATTGKISVTTSAGTGSSTADFIVGPPPGAPTIAAFSPASAEAGAVVTVTGTNLNGASAVRFNGVTAIIGSTSATSLTATVPATAASGKISVTTSAGTATSATDFIIAYPPAVADAAHTAATRFLTQASFGPKPASIARVKAIGPAAWIDEQLAKPAASHMAYITDAKARRLASQGKAYFTEEDSYEAIWQQWLFGDDELRARMSFALSEIMVISNIAPDLEPDAMSSYMDLLNANAFGNYRDLLGAVTLHPAMGYYLNMLGSEKEDAKNNKFPNENYAREVLQLFSVGLYQLNPDGSRKVDGAGVPLATYDESVVKGFARAFTGWTFFGNDPNNPKKFDRPEESWTQPLIAFPSKHEPGTKKLLTVTLPAGQTPEKDMKDALDNIFNHPNVGPFIGRQLIQRFVTSNPSPAYVNRVSAVFDNDGRGVRGNLAAVIKAVLLDNEARTPSTEPKAGKQREPVIRLANILRAFNATSTTGRNAIHYLDSADDALGQSPLLSPSVFNFFSPSYTRAGRLAQAGMVAPEFQITNEIQTVGTANFFYQLAKGEGYGSGDTKLRLDLAAAKSLADKPAALVDHLSSLLTYGDLAPASRQAFIDAVAAVPFTSKDSERALRVRTALTLFALSPDFVIQK